MDDSDIWIGIETPVFKTSAISVNGSGAVAADTSQVGIDEQTTDQCGVFVCDAGFLEAGGRSLEAVLHLHGRTLLAVDSYFSPSHLHGPKFQ